MSASAHRRRRVPPDLTGRFHVLTASGDLLGDGLRAFEVAARPYLTHGDAGLVFDLAAAKFLSGDAFRYLIGVAMSLDAQGRLFALAHPRPAVAATIIRLELGRVLQVFSTVEAAAEWIRRGGPPRSPA